ncbi:acyl-CoA thioesterase [Georgenia sp. Z1344]|uniref:acyl-CoA thioesterase n=1 Tax=Georgenia sp. Z1344 TaxID=3416706 RepID=UPI003CF71C5A
MSDEQTTHVGVPSVPPPPGDRSGVLDVPSSDSEQMRRILDAMRLERTGDDTYAAESLPQLSGRIYGGQVLAQAILAADDTLVDDGDGPRLLHSAHGYFLRPGNADHGVTLAVERLHDGRSFSTRRSHAFQGGKPILSIIFSFQETQPGLEHHDPAPDAPDPETLPSAIDLFESVDHPVARFMSSTAAFDIRHVGPSIYLGPDPDRSDTQMLWMRARAPLPEGSSQLLHRALLAYACDQVMLEPVLRRQGLTWRTDGLSMASLDHSMWWHRELRVDDWLLFVQRSPSAQGGRGLGTAEVYDRSGALVSTIGQEGMVRVPEPQPHVSGSGPGEQWRRPSLR